MNSFAKQLRLMMARCLSTAALALMLAGASLTARAQQPTPTPFSSGSTGADGPFAPTSSRTIQVPDNGVFNFTTVNIPVNVAIGFKPNSRNTPVTILAQGDVRIAGYLDVGGNSGDRQYGNAGGPGGFRGGNGGVWLSSEPSGKPGDGPGGGAGAAATPNGSDASGGGGGSFFNSGGSGREGGPNPAAAGRTYGSKILLPLIGGSGGGGASAYLNQIGGGGGGGGGAILIASSTRIIFESGWSEMGIYSIGGNAGCFNICGGGGSGGAIRLVANTITGTPRLWAYGGGASGFRGNTGGEGYIRYEAGNLTDFRPDFRGYTNFSFGRPNPALLPNNPQLRIASVGGANAPAQPGGSFYTLDPDIVLLQSATNPMNVVIQATNVPLTPTVPTVQVTRYTEAGERVTETCTLVGSPASSTCTASHTLPLSQRVVLIATLTIDGLLAFGKPLFIDGERVKNVEIAAAFGGASQLTYITESGRRIKLSE